MLDLFRFNQAYIVGFYKIERLDSKCIEYGFKEDITNHQLNLFFRKKSKYRKKKQKKKNRKKKKKKINK